MDVQVPAAGRFTVHSNSDGLVIAIPAIRGTFGLIFMAIWLCGWTFGGYSALGEFLAPSVSGEGKAFLFFWLFGWFLGECFAIWTILWQLFGRDLIIATTGYLTLKKVLFVGLRTRIFSVANIRNMELNVSENGDRHGALSFDYGSKTTDFAAGLDKAEARAVLEILKKRVPSVFKGEQLK